MTPLEMFLVCNNLTFDRDRDCRSTNTNTNTTNAATEQEEETKSAQRILRSREWLEEQEQFLTNTKQPHPPPNLPPLCTMLKQGIQSEHLKCMFELDDTGSRTLSLQLEEQSDTCGGLYPFMVAAAATTSKSTSTSKLQSQSQCDLSTVYSLVLMRLDLIF